MSRRKLHFDALPTLQTERLILRPLTMHDAADIFDYARDPRVSIFLPWAPHETIDATKEILTKWTNNYATNKAAPWGIVDRASQKVIGTIAADEHRNENTDGARMYLGYCLSPAYWGKGLMGEAARAVIDYIFAHTDFTEIEAFVAIDNVQSRRVMEKLGMINDPSRSRREFVKERWFDLEC